MTEIRARFVGKEDVDSLMFGNLGMRGAHIKGNVNPPHNAEESILGRRIGFLVFATIETGRYLKDVGQRALAQFQRSDHPGVSLIDTIPEGGTTVNSIGGDSTPQAVDAFFGPFMGDTDPKHSEGEGR